MAAIKHLLTALGVLLASITLAQVQAQTLRWTARGDTRGMDPHSYVEQITINMNALVYDALVERDRQQQIVPALATSWTTTPDGLVWRFRLRSGVKFHDGTPLTAADVVFSVQRAQQPTSDFAVFARPLGSVSSPDPQTIEFRLSQPNPLMLDHLASLLVMSRDWCVAHQVERVPESKARQEAYTAGHAMGTGRFILKERAPNERIVFARNPAWWGRFDGNVAEVVYLPIENDATRTAALLSGDVNFNQDVAPQDLEQIASNRALRLIGGTEYRLILLGFDQASDELRYASVRGRNPFKDARVREAFARAIDTEVLRTRIMRGQSMTTGCFAIASAGCLDEALEPRVALDLGRARALMAAAGYGSGFELTLDCPNDRYLNDRALCVAVVGMLARIGVTLKVDARPKALFFQKLLGNDTSFYMLGWGGTGPDAQPALDAVVHSPDKASGKGGFNSGRLSDPALDRLIDAAGVEAQPETRRALIAAAQRLVHSNYYYLPLHRQRIAWASRANLRATFTASNLVRVDWMHID